MKSLGGSWRTEDSKRVRKARRGTFCYNCQVPIPKGGYFVWRRTRIIGDNSFGKVFYKLVPLCIQCFAELPSKIKGG